VARIAERETEIQALGASVAVIGCGKPRYIEAFRETVGTSVPIFTDSGLETFDALEFRRGMGSLLSWTMIKRGVEAFREGHRQVGTQGEPLQLGGVLVVTPSSDVAYRYASDFAGDHPDLEDVIGAIPRTSID
jgi:hypothetical protein